MAKKLLLTAGVSVALMVVLFLVYSITEKVAAKKIIHSKIQTLPRAKVYDLDSSSLSLPPSALAIIFFNPSCEHCQYELKDLKKDELLFSKKEIILLSSETISTIKKTAEEYGLASLPNFQFAKINAADVFDTFGPVTVPHIFIYGADHKLIKEFKGETKIELIAKYLPDIQLAD